MISNTTTMMVQLERGPWFSIVTVLVEALFEG